VNQIQILDIDVKWNGRLTVDFAQIGRIVRYVLTADLPLQLENLLLIVKEIFARSDQKAEIAI
jgi:hypothetical protein